MAKRRAATEAFILKYLNALAPGGPTVDLYKKRFAAMDDAAFDQYMAALQDGSQTLVLYSPNFAQPALNLRRNLDVADALGHQFFQRLWIGAQGDTPAYLTPIPYLVVDLPFRRASQVLSKKIKIPENNRTVDTLTGQPAGSSKGSKVTFEEIRLLAAMRLDNCLEELIKYRGGDQRGFAAMNAMIGRYGTASLKTLGNFASGVESTRTLKTFLKAMHIQSTL